MNFYTRFNYPKYCCYPCVLFLLYFMPKMPLIFQLHYEQNGRHGMLLKTSFQCQNFVLDGDFLRLKINTFILLWCFFGTMLFHHKSILFCAYALRRIMASGSKRGTYFAQRNVTYICTLTALFLKWEQIITKVDWIKFRSNMPNMSLMHWLILMIVTSFFRGRVINLFSLRLEFLNVNFLKFNSPLLDL